MTGSKTPAVTVIVAAYDVADYIHDSINSLKEQTFSDFEALIVDDGSSDATQEVARQAVGNDPRFQIIHQSNQGLSGARNVGLDRARGSFVAFLDGDDRFDPEFLSVLIEDLVSSGGDWVACGLAFCAPDGSRHIHSAIHGRPDPDIQSQTMTYPLSDWSEVIRHFPSAWNKLYRRDFLGDIRFDKGTWFEDHAFFQRLAAKTDVIRHIPRCLYLYRVERAGQITRTDSDRVFEQFTVLDTCAKIMRSSDKAGADQGLARLATRLCNERLDAIATPDRAARFYQQAAAFFARHHLHPDWSWDPFLSAVRSISLTGTAPITIRRTHPAKDDLNRTEPMKPEDLEPPPLIAEVARSAPLPKAGLVLDMVSQAPIDQAALIRNSEILLHSDCAALLLPLDRPEGPCRPPAGLLEKVPALLPPELILSLDPTEVAILAKPSFGIRIAQTDPELGLVEQALRIAQSGERVMWITNPIAQGRPVNLPSISERRKALARLSVELNCTVMPAGWERRLFLRTVSAHIARLQQDHVTLRRRLRLLFPVARVWWMGLLAGWIGAPGEVDRATQPILRRIFKIPKIG